MKLSISSKGRPYMSSGKGSNFLGSSAPSTTCTFDRGWNPYSRTSCTCRDSCLSCDFSVYSTTWTCCGALPVGGNQIEWRNEGNNLALKWKAIKLQNAFDTFSTEKKENFPLACFPGEIFSFFMSKKFVVLLFLTKQLVVHAFKTTIGIYWLQNIFLGIRAAEGESVKKSFPTHKCFTIASSVWARLLFKATFEFLDNFTAYEKGSSRALRDSRRLKRAVIDQRTDFRGWFRSDWLESIVKECFC